MFMIFLFYFNTFWLVCKRIIYYSIVHSLQNYPGNQVICANKTVKLRCFRNKLNTIGVNIILHQNKNKYEWNLNVYGGCKYIQLGLLFTLFYTRWLIGSSSPNMDIFLIMVWYAQFRRDGINTQSSADRWFQAIVLEH